LGFDGYFFVFECFDDSWAALLDEVYGFFAVELEGVAGAVLFDIAEVFYGEVLDDADGGGHWGEFEHDCGGVCGGDVSWGVFDEDESYCVGAVVDGGLGVVVVCDATDFYFCSLVHF